MNTINGFERSVRAPRHHRSAPYPGVSYLPAQRCRARGVHVWRRIGVIESDPCEETTALAWALSRIGPRHQIEALSRALIKRHGSIAAVVASLEANAGGSRCRLAGGPDLGQVARELRKARAFAASLLRSRVEDRDCFSDLEHTVDYLRLAIGFLPEEHLHVLMLNARNHLIADIDYGSGTVDMVSFFPRKILRDALDVGATALIVAHNHPSGDPSPSKDDIRVTRQLATAASALGITVHDHVIVAQGRHCSLRASGHLP